MVQINFAQKTVNVKVVYYGPGMSGKTTNLEIVHQRAPEANHGELTSISTDGDRTLFFDYMPLNLGTVAGMRTCFQLYTVPGQVYYNSTRKLVLQGVDGVIFVADSSASMMSQNLDSLRNLEENLNEYGKSLSQIPMVIQWNKRDVPDALPVEELERTINSFKVPTFEGMANTGQGVFPTLKAVAALVLKSIMNESAGTPSFGSSTAPAPPAAVPAPAAASPLAAPPLAAPPLAAPPLAAPPLAAPGPLEPTPALRAPIPMTAPDAGVPTQPVAGTAAPIPTAAGEVGAPRAPVPQGGLNPALSTGSAQTPLAPAAPQTEQAPGTQHAPARRSISGGGAVQTGSQSDQRRRATRTVQPLRTRPKKFSKGGLLTALFVIVGVALGAVLAWFAMSIL
jgi:signal recognition particle receptor subunit beta